MAPEMERHPTISKHLRALDLAALVVRMNLGSTLTQKTYRGLATTTKSDDEHLLIL